MASYNIIIGENGQGKTRYLLNYLNSNIASKNIAVISTSNINPFPQNSIFRDSQKKFSSFNMRLGSPYPFSGGLSRQVSRNINRLIDEELPDDLFFVLDFLGFDQIIRINIKPIFKIKLLNSSNNIHDDNFVLKYTGGSSLMTLTGLSQSQIDKGIKISKSFVELYGQYFERDFTVDFVPHGGIAQYPQYKHAIEIINSLNKIIFGKRKDGLSLFEIRYEVSKELSFFRLEEASSGELYIFSLGLFIRKTLNSFRSNNNDTVFLIDEPENSLHPKWQKEYLNFLRAFIGYSSVTVYIATHSPFIAIGSEAHEAKILKMTKGHLQEEKKNIVQANIEEIYLELFDVLTPKNKFLSELCNNLLKNYAEGNSSYIDTMNYIESLITKTYDEQQKKFLVDITKLLDKIHLKNSLGRYDNGVY